MAEQRKNVLPPLDLLFTLGEESLLAVSRLGSAESKSAKQEPVMTRFFSAWGWDLPWVWGQQEQPL
jgi:hypothetical protein